MRLAMAQMRMTDSMRDNLDRTLRMMGQAKQAGADLVLFPEVQLSPFFAKHPGRDAGRWACAPDGPEIAAIRGACRTLSLWTSPNVYLETGGKRYDASLMIGGDGSIHGISKMVYIFQTENFYEKDYYAPSEEGFRVYDTPFGRIGIVICFDRHIPHSIHACAKAGAALVLVPTANLTSEPAELFAWEMRVQAYQNTVFVAMSNRTGEEDGLVFCGESLIAGPDGSLVCQAGAEETLCCADINLAEAARERAGRDWLSF